MRWLDRFRLRLRSLFRRDAAEADLADEFEFHLDQEIQENLARGMQPAEARAAALRSIGGIAQLQEECRDMRRVNFIETAAADIRYAVRGFRRQPAFWATAILVLALGIGAATSIFSVVNAALIRPLPYRDPERLVALSSVYERAGASRSSPTVSLNEVEYWRAQSQSLESLGSFVFTALPAIVNSQAMFLTAIGADPELLRTLGVPMAMGRQLPGSGSRVRDGSAVISRRLWSEAFHEDPAVVGRSITINGSAAVVAGVLPASFQFPRADASYFPEEPDVIFPIANIADNWGRNSAQWFAIGRLKPDATAAQAESELKALTTRLAAAYAGLRGTSVRVSALDRETRSSVRPALLISLGIALVLLLIACSNVMNLLFSRAGKRRREMAVRQAVGASSGRLVRQMLTESACLTFLAGALGVGTARLALASIVALSPSHLPVSGQVVIDWPVLGFAVLACAGATVLAGLLPAMYLSGRRVAAIPLGGRAIGSRAVRRWQQVLMVVQIALGMALMSAAGLLAHSLLRLSSVDPGFRTRGAVGFEVAFPSGIPQSRAPQIYERILEATRSVPGVVSAGWITLLPPETRAGVFVGFSIPGARFEAQPFCNFEVASEDYFRTAGIGLARGRDFSSADSAGTTAVAIINETLARHYFQGINPLGRRVLVMGGEREIVGIIRDLHDRGLGVRPVPTVFVPFRQFALAYGAVMARTSLQPDAVLPEIRRRIAAAEPEIPIRSLATIDARLRKTLDVPRFYAVIAVACALMAILFVTLGLYGVISYAVASRTSEIGVRIALGAQHSAILSGVLRDGLKLAAVGVAMGSAISLAGARPLRAFLFEVRPLDPVTLGVAAALIVILTLAACYLPARRAGAVDPVAALRED